MDYHTSRGGHRVSYLLQVKKHAPPEHAELYSQEHHQRTAGIHSCNKTSKTDNLQILPQSDLIIRSGEVVCVGVCACVGVGRCVEGRGIETTDTATDCEII